MRIGLLYWHERRIDVQGQIIEDVLTSTLAQGVLANGVFAVLLILGRCVMHSIGKGNPRYRQILILFAVVIWGALNFAIRDYFPLLLSSVIIVGFLGWEVVRLWFVGIVGCDREIRIGIDYAKSLSMCKTSMEFLGVGAAKLTAQSGEFENAIRRCASDVVPVRLLLCDPASENLAIIAKQAGVPEEEYRRKVRESLRVIADLRNRREQNIQVRFYPTRFMPLFRLIFINGSICLASHYKFGEGDGSDVVFDQHPTATPAQLCR